MISEAQLLSLRANQRFLAAELLARNIEVELLAINDEVLEARFGNHTEILLDIDSSVVPYASSVVAGNKALTKRLLRRVGVSVPPGEVFSLGSVTEILEYAGTIGYPLVLKPTFGAQGESVHTGLDSEDELLCALIEIDRARGPSEVILEKQIEGNEYRLFVTRTGEYASVLRDPAHVIADGRHSIEELAQSESEKRLNPRRNCLGRIALDSEAQRFLRKQGLDFNSVPPHGEKIYLRGSSNIAMGGVAEDVTEIVHPNFIEIGLQALSAIPNLPYAGLDIITRDISVSPAAYGYAVLEINSVPGIGIHHAPGIGKARNVAGMIADLIFPETVERKIVFKSAA